MARYELPAMAISAATGEGVQPMLVRVQQLLAELPAEEAEPTDLVEIAPSPNRRAFRVDALADGVWLVEGTEIEKVAKMTNWEYYEAALRFQRILTALGITDALREAGVEDGDCFDDAQLDQSIWMDAEGERASFRNARLVESVLQKAKFRHCSFDGASVRHADMAHAELGGSRFVGTDMYRTGLRGVRADGAEMPNRGQAAPDDEETVKAENWRPAD